MLHRASVFALLLAATVMAVGCGSSDDSSAASRSVTLKGNIGAPTTIGTRVVGNGRVDGSVRVSAHELHARGSSGQNVDATVAADGTFKLDLSRGSRWVVTIDDAEGESAMVSFDNGAQTALEVTSDGDTATVDVGAIRVEGMSARTDVRIAGAFGLNATTVRTDEVFRDVRGALVDAAEAIAAAENAVQEALAAAQAAAAAAQAAADAARRAAEAAQDRP